MCSAPKVDNSAQQQAQEDARRAREEEEARQRRIREGTERINEAFSGFDDAFYSGYQNAALGYTQPELDKQFTDARDQLSFALARAGTLDSTIAGSKQADLTSAYDHERARLLADAFGQADQLRTQVANERSDLINLLNATGDADMASREALSRRQIFQQKTPTPSAVGPIFSGVLGSIGTGAQAYQDRRMLDNYFGTAGGGRGSSGSGRVVRG